MELTKSYDVAERAASIRSQRDLYEYYHSIFQDVTQAYVRTKQLPLVVSHPFDHDDPNGLNERLTVDGIHFACDVERITESALKDDLEKQAAWFSLVAGEMAPSKLAKVVVLRCGRLYAARGLQPSRYFRQNRYPKKLGTQWRNQ